MTRAKCTSMGKKMGRINMTNRLDYKNKQAFHTNRLELHSECLNVSFIV
jgi:hypothetical protein